MGWGFRAFNRAYTSTLEVQNPHPNPPLKGEGIRSGLSVGSVFKGHFLRSICKPAEPAQELPLILKQFAHADPGLDLIA